MTGASLTTIYRLHRMAWTWQKVQTVKEGGGAGCRKIGRQMRSPIIRTPSPSESSAAILAFCASATFNRRRVFDVTERLNGVCGLAIALPQLVVLAFAELSPALTGSARGLAKCLRVET